MHFQRRAAAGQVSIERVFANVRKAMPAEVECEVQVSPHFSRGVFPRLANLREAARHAGPVNHVTGDVHYLALALEGRRTLLTVHDCVSLERLRGLKRALFRWFWYVEPVRRAAVVSVVSEATRRELMRQVRCGPEKVRVVHNCVGSEFVPAPKVFNGAEPVILQVGTGPNKNLTGLIAALGGLKCRLNIIGSLTDAQRGLLAEHGIVYSNVPSATDAEVLRAYRECDLVVFASVYEGFGLPMVEANATGRPVVASNAEPMREVAGEAACFVEPREPGSIRAGILRVLGDAGYREEQVRKGLENAKRFRAEAVAAEYVRLYEEILSNA